MSPKRIIIADVGKVIECTAKTCKLAGTVPPARSWWTAPASAMSAASFFAGPEASGSGRHDCRLRQPLLRGRQRLSGPDIITRGFVYVKDNEDLMEAMRIITLSSLEDCQARRIRDRNAIKTDIKTTSRPSSTRIPSAAP